MSGFAEFRRDRKLVPNHISHVTLELRDKRMITGVRPFRRKTPLIDLIMGIKILKDIGMAEESNLGAFSVAHTELRGSINSNDDIVRLFKKLDCLHDSHKAHSLGTSTGLIG